MKNLFETNPDFTSKHDMRRCKVNGKEMFCTEERIADKDMPEGLYKAEVRGNDLDSAKWETIEPFVGVNHTATLVSDEPFEYDREEEIKGRKFQYSDVENYEIERDPDLDAGGEDTATYAAEGIVWDCDGVSPEEYGLPQSDIVEAEGELYVADRLSDKYGFCVVAIESIKELD